VIAVQDISIQFVGRALFKGVSFVIQPRERLALVGPNGAGKSTMLKMLAGIGSPDTGKIIRARGVRVGYLAQEGIEARGRSVRAEAEDAFSGVLALQHQIDELGDELAKLDSASDDYREVLERMGDLQIRLDESDAARIRSKVETVLQGLGFALSDIDRPCEEFSGGWQMRIALARLLLQEPELLLLDEPTNHLDMDSLRWVEKYLQGYRGALVLISHDRAFLDSLIRRTLAFGAGRVEEYAGNYSFYVRESVARRELLLKAKANQDREIEKTKQFIDRFRAKASKATQAQSRIKMLEKVERIEIEEDGPEIRFSFPPAPASGHAVVKLENVTMAYGDHVVIDSLDFTIEKGDRIAIVGPNGAGKSTFSRLITKREVPTFGTLTHGYNVRVSHFAQDQAEELDPTLTALQTLEKVDISGARIDRRSVLGCFLFRGDDVFKLVSVLSGGEKSRLALASMLLHPSNFLVLDEPTNHLDMASQARLQSALLDYEGTFAIVSHNRDFLDPLVNKVLEFRPGRPPRLYLGNLSDYVEAKEAEERSEALRSATARPGTSIPLPHGHAAPETIPANRKEQRKLEAKIREQRTRVLKPLLDELTTLEETIAALETEKVELARRLQDPALYEAKEEAALVARRLEEAGRELEARYTRWNDLTEDIAAKEAEIG
jgi:ATP-binding cassette subfamily F protein 3